MIFSIRAVAVAAAGLALTLGATHVQAPPVKLAYVDPGQLMAASPGRVEAESTFAKESKDADAELQKLGADLDALIQEYTKTEATLSATAKEAKQKVITDKRSAANARTLQLQQKIAARQDELQLPLREAIKKVLEDIRVEDGYTMIMDASIVLAADKNLDITDRVVARLKMMKSKGPVSQPAGVQTKRPPPPRIE